MASNQTTNLGLSQWGPDDEVLRADFNSDNAKIDAAFANLRLSTFAPVLAHLVVQEDTSAAVLDVSGLDLSVYQYLYLDMYQIGNGAYVTVALTVNKIGSYSMHYNTTSTSTENMGLHGIASAVSTSEPLRIVIPVYGRGSVSLTAWREGYHQTYYTPYCTPMTLETLNIKVLSDKDTIPAGTVLELRGAR